MQCPLRWNGFCERQIGLDVEPCLARFSALHSKVVVMCSNFLYCDLVMGMLNMKCDSFYEKFVRMVAV
jgi:hypothetical protein